MTLTRAEVIEAITSNNTARTAEMLEKFDLTKNTPPFFTDTDKNLVSTMLNFASAMSYCNGLDSSLAKELIDRTAMTVDIFYFAHLVAIAAKIETDNFDIIPENIRAALRENNYTDEITDAIEKLDNDAFAALLALLLSKEIEVVNMKFSLPIVRRIHTGETIPEHSMFAYMALCPRETIEEHRAARS